MAINKKFAAIAGGVTAVGATVALTAGTFSYFTEAKTVDGAGGKVTFGTLHLTAGSSAGNQAFSIPVAKPGDTVLTSSLGFDNAGNIDGVLKLQVVPDSGNVDSFNNAVQITLAGFGAYNASIPLNGQHSLADDAKLGEVNASPMFGAKNGAPGRHKSIPITVSIDPAAGNDVQGLSGGFTIVATLVQAGSPDGPAQDNF